MEVNRELHTPGIHWIGGWVGPGVGLDAVERKKIPAPAGNRTRACWYGCLPYLVNIMSWDTSVSTVIKLWAGRPGFESRQKEGLSIHHNVQRGSGAHPASWPESTEDYFQRDKATGACS
jgi:hypothetical protein